jgi:hypothetical protein
MYRRDYRENCSRIYTPAGAAGPPAYCIVSSPGPIAACAKSPDPTVCYLISRHEIKSQTEREKVVSREEDNGFVPLRRTSVRLRQRRLPRSPGSFLLSYGRNDLT